MVYLYKPVYFSLVLFSSSVDWTEDVLQGIVPAVLGVNITGSVFLGILGVIADSLNHLVFTMPFLPSEGEETKLLINEQMNDVLVFHYLPILWYRYPIPNEIREFWYKERTDILNYMQKAYKNLDIQFLPDSILKELNQRTLTTELSSTYTSLLVPESSINHSIPTELLSTQTFLQSDHFLTALNFLNQKFQTIFLTYTEKLF